MSEYTRRDKLPQSGIYIYKLKEPTINDSWYYDGGSKKKNRIRSVLYSYKSFTTTKSPIVSVIIKYKYKRDRHRI